MVFRDRAGGPTLRHYRLLLRPPAGDREPANDVARLMVRVRGRQPVLVVRERSLSDVQERLGVCQVRTHLIGRVAAGERGVVYVN